MEKVKVWEVGPARVLRGGWLNVLKVLELEFGFKCQVISNVIDCFWCKIVVMFSH